MIIEFPKKTESLREELQAYFDKSEVWSREQNDDFWAEQKARNTELWKVYGEKVYA